MDLVTHRHVLIDKPSGHLPDRIEIEVHTDADNLTHAAVLSVLPRRDGPAIWHQRRAGGDASRRRGCAVAQEAAGRALRAPGDRPVGVCAVG
jgi:hypothetical protein